MNINAPLLRVFAGSLFIVAAIICLFAGAAWYYFVIGGTIGILLVLYGLGGLRAERGSGNSERILRLHEPRRHMHLHN